MRKHLYFLINDLLTKLKGIKRRWLYFVPFILLGVIVGVIVAVNLEESELTSSLGNVIAGEFEPFNVFFKYMALLFVYLILVYLSQKKKLFMVLLLAFSVYIGYIIGRVATLTSINDGIVGIISLLLFFLPSVSIVILSAIITFSTIDGKLSCMFSFSADKEELKGILGIYCATVLMLFLLNVIIGSVINLIVNIV